jgi:hypothetical protein
MDYKKIYDNFMLDRLNKKPERLLLKKTGVYFEGHHIIPKSKGGDGNSNRPKNNPNIVLLTAREHFLAHWILWRIYRDRQTALSFHKMMSITKSQDRISSSRGYGEAREAFRLTNIGNQYGKGKPKVVSDEQKRKQSEIMKGRYDGEKNPFYGKKHTQTSKEKIKKSREGINKEMIWNYSGTKIVLKDGEIVGVFENSEDVAKFIGCSHSNVRHVLSGNQKSAKGYQIKHSNK